MLRIICKHIVMNRPCPVYIILVTLVMVAACSNEEPFDVIGAQRQLSGKWDCTESSGKTYQIAISPNGVVNIHIYNLCDIGEDIAVNANLLDENNLLIPSQGAGGHSIEGTGKILDKYKKLVFELHFDNTTKDATPVVVTCNKKK